MACVLSTRAKAVRQLEKREEVLAAMMTWTLTWASMAAACSFVAHLLFSSLDCTCSMKRFVFVYEQRACAIRLAHVLSSE
jgi:hypothetical protein